MMLSNLKTAVALKYPENADAPFITAKEKGVLAEKMIEIAKENNIPLVENNELANVLSLQEVGDCIPESTWISVAKIFAFIQNLEKKNV